MHPDNNIHDTILFTFLLFIYYVYYMSALFSMTVVSTDSSCVFVCHRAAHSVPGHQIVPPGWAGVP